MAVSGTLDFSPSITDIGLDAFGRCQIRLSSLTPDHMQSLRMSCNLVLSSWSNKGVNLWVVDDQTLDLTQGVATYDLAPGTIQVLDVYLRITSGDAPIDRLLYPMGRSEYASLPNKTQQGAPTSYWNDVKRTLQQMTFWPTPDDNGPYILHYYRMRQIYDMNAKGTQTADLPYNALEAYTAKLAHQLSMTWAPQRSDKLEEYSDKMWNEFAAQNREVVPLHLTPELSGYYR